MADGSDNQTSAVTGQQDEHHEHVGEWKPSDSKIVRFYSHPWTQILLISAICFCLPGVSSYFVCM